MTCPARTLLCLASLVTAFGGPPAPSVTPQDQALPPGAERAYAALATRFDRAAAMETVAFMQQFWRIAGNPGFNASIDHIRDQLTKSGFQSIASTSAPFIRVDAFPKGLASWDYLTGTLWIEGDLVPVLSREQDRVSLAINSFSTSPGSGVRLRLVDVGAGANEGDYAGKDVKGAVVLGDAAIVRLWQQAVRSRGAAGVVSTEIAGYIRPSDPAAMSDEQRDVLQWGVIPYDAKLSSFGFKASWRAASRLRAALARNQAAAVRVAIEARSYPGPYRTLVAEIPGRTRANERIVMVAHVQEPGANDNASGCATLLGIAKAIADAVSRGALPPPERTLTFLWGDEITVSREWIALRTDEADGVQYMFSMDMTGEDTAKTGGTFMIEKEADPSAVWERPSDPHSEWSAGKVKLQTLKGSLLNDLHIAVANRRARDTGWVVRTNPYEGGSDHTTFASAGVPSLLNWHFTDRFYHTNQDTLDKVSAAEMENVAALVGTSAYFLASASAEDAMNVIALIERAAEARLALERKQGGELVAKAPDKAAAERVEHQVIAAWKAWYGRAFDSIGRLPVAGPTPEMSKAIADAQERLVGR